MSLDFHLEAVRVTTVYSGNITHNLRQMASEAGVYDVLWKPHEHGYTKAGQIIPILRDGVKLLESNPKRFKKFDSPNGWGLYVHFVPFVKGVLAACEENPDADIVVTP